MLSPLSVYSGQSLAVCELAPAQHDMHYPTPRCLSCPDDDHIHFQECQKDLFATFPNSPILAAGF